MTNQSEWRPYIGEEVRVAEHIALTWPEWRDQPLFVVGLSKDRLGGQYPIDGINVTVSEEWPLTSSTTGFTDDFWIGRLDKPDDLAPVVRAALEQAGEPVVDDAREKPAGEHGEQCERCQGNGEIVTDWDRYMHAHDGDVGDEAVADCPDCSGTGRIEGEAPLSPLQRLGKEFEASDIVIDLDKRRVSILARAGLLLSALVGKGDVGGQDPDELFAGVIMALGIEDEAYGDDLGALQDAANHPEEHLLSDRFAQSRVAAEPVGLREALDREFGSLHDDVMIDAKSVRSRIDQALATPSQPEPQSNANEVEERKFYLSDWTVSQLLEARSDGLVTDDGEAWRYRYTHKDAKGKYDLLYRPQSRGQAFDGEGEAWDIIDMLAATFRRWIEIGADKQPHFKNGLRPWGSSELAHMADRLAALSSAKRGEG